MSENKLTINVIKTNKGCFISDCNVVSGYDYNYHRSQIPNLYFDREKATESYLKNWYFVKQYPEKIQVLEKDKRINERYVLKNPEMESKALPFEVKNLPSESVYNLYDLKYDIKKGELIDFDVQLNIVCEVNNFQEAPLFNYNGGMRSINFKDVPYIITNANIQHQLLDKLIIPEILIHNYPCEINSVDLYHIIRQYIKDNINTKYAIITSDYDFCFAVKKLIPLYEPKSYTYTNLFAKTKKEKEKVHKGVSTFKEVVIFEMTHEGSKYQSYTCIKPLTARNEWELKEKLDSLLKEIIEYINEPLIECEHCKGMGWINVQNKFDINKID